MTRDSWKSVFLVLLLRFATGQKDPVNNENSISSERFSGCSRSDYYNGVNVTDRDQLEALLTTTHRRILRYTSNDGSDDVWLALRELNPGESADTVRLVYSQTDMDVSLQGAMEGWNREHLWPRSYGVGNSGADYTDVHSIAPSTWNVNAARGNKYFGSCSDSSEQQQGSACVQPAHANAAPDTQMNAQIFQPPASVRGDIARALMYMDVRYSGAREGETDLILTNCPRELDNSMGILSQLLQWHIDDPVSEQERIRNGNVCTFWQGNRNPFVDFPDLAETYFGSYRTVQCENEVQGGFTAAGVDESSGGEIDHGEGSSGNGTDEDSDGIDDVDNGEEENSGNDTDEVTDGNDVGDGEGNEGNDTEGGEVSDDIDTNDEEDTDENDTEGDEETEVEEPGQLPYVEPNGIPPFSSCSRDNFYRELSSTVAPSRAELESLLQTTHRRRVPYGNLNDSGDSVWKALVELFPGASPDTIRLSYSGVDAPVSSAGIATGWQPDQLWPQSRGIGLDGLDWTDLHNIVPAYFTLDQARGARPFGACPNEDGCTVPAFGLTAAATDTASSRTTFLPPANIRGDIARALFYMDVRYSGHMEKEEDLRLSDCPGNNGVPEYGFLSDLLKWHLEDPVSDEERARNDMICEQYQGNRNPFVDTPQLASVFFGSPKSRPYECAVPDNPILDNSVNCPGPGSVMVIGFNSEYPDTFALVALERIPQGTIIYMTDNAWTGRGFRDTEGYLRLQVPNTGIAAGTVFGYSQDPSNGRDFSESSDWELVRGNFALSPLGDTMLVVCDDRREGLTFMTGLTFSGRWFNAGGDTSYSALPDSLERVSNSYVTLTHFDNYRYMGPTSGTAYQLREAIANPMNWEGSNEVRFENLETSFSFDVLPPIPGEGEESNSPVAGPQIESLGASSDAVRNCCWNMLLVTSLWMACRL